MECNKHHRKRKKKVKSKKTHASCIQRCQETPVGHLFCIFAVLPCANKTELVTAKPTQGEKKTETRSSLKPANLKAVWFFPFVAPNPPRVAESHVFSRKLGRVFKLFPSARSLALQSVLMRKEVAFSQTKETRVEGEKRK